MFSGIVEELGTVVENSEGKGLLVVQGAVFSGELPGDDSPELPREGDSIAVSGVCLTVTKLLGDTAYFDLATETRRCSNLGQLAAGDHVNLERSLRIGSRLHGHFVQGHVDQVTRVVSVRNEENTWRYEFTLPSTLRRFIVAKGSVALDGVSLTVGEVSESSFSV